MEISFTDRELDIMGVLWANGPATVAEVRERLDEDLAYNTVLTMLRILEEKGFVSHTPEGRAHRYHPLVERTEAGQSAVRKLVRKVFGGSRELLLTELVSDRDVDEEELRRLRELLDRRLDGEVAP